MNSDNIWYLFNECRGIVDTHIFVSLTNYLFLLKKIELKKPEYYNNNFTLNFLSRLFGDLVPLSDVCDYINMIEQDNNIPHGMLVDPFRNIVLKFNNENNLKVLLNIFGYVSNINIENEEELVQIYDTFIEHTLSYRDTSEHGTNQYLAKLEAKLLDVQEGDTIYDPFCGYGSSMISACGKNNMLSFRDINFNCIALSVINCLIHDCKISEVNCGDSLYAPNGNFDRVISEPPFGVKHSNDTFVRLKEINGFLSKETMEIEKIINNLNETGKAIVLAPMGILFSGRTTRFRSKVISKILKCVISIPSGVLPYTSVNSTILIFDKTKETDDVFMVDSSSFWEKDNGRTYKISNENINKIFEIVRDRKNIKAISKVVKKSTIDENELNLTPAIYVDPFTVDDIKVRDISEIIIQQAAYEQEFTKISRELSEFRKLNPL